MVVNTEGVTQRRTAVQPTMKTSPTQQLDQMDSNISPTHQFEQKDSNISPTHQLNQMDSNISPTHQFEQKDSNISPTHRSEQKDPDHHPAGPVKHGGPMQALRIFLFTIFFTTTCFFIHGAQMIGLPLYLYNKDYFYAWMALTKQYFGLLATLGTQWWSPTVIRVSGHESVKGQLKQLPDGRLCLDFPDRIVLIANHQIYTDWLYLWWASYTAGLHGHIYIILKESLKYIPFIGPGMMLYNFIFMARKWEKDQPRLRHRLQKLNTRHSGPMSGEQGAGQLDPMWLLIFPEGTNLSRNTRSQSARWSEKSGTPDLKHGLLPRSTGLRFCLSELNDTVEYLYDCTICYEGTSPGQLASEIFTLRSVYFQGRPPKSVNMYWRRFKLSDIPIHDDKAMEDWVLKRWQEKDAIIDHYQQTGRLPADREAVHIQGQVKPGNGYIETEVKLGSTLEFLQIFVPVLAAGLVGRILVKMMNFALTGRF